MVVLNAVSVARGSLASYLGAVLLAGCLEALGCKMDRNASNTCVVLLRRNGTRLLASK